MRPILDIGGQRFGSLVAVSVEKREGKRPLWMCKCDCGRSAHATNGELRSGRKKECSVCAKERVNAACLAAGFGAPGALSVNHKHGAANRNQHTKEYRAWEAMIRRCTMPSQRNFPIYGGRGISVCEAWRKDFLAFLADVGAAPSPKHTLERRNVNGHYEPGNVIWATWKEQCNNKSVSVMVSHAGQTMTVAQWAEKIGVKYQTLWARLFVSKWPASRALASCANPPAAGCC